MNIDSLTQQKHIDGDAIWRMFVETKSEYRELNEEAQQLREKQSAIAVKMQAKLKLLNGLKAVLIAQAKDEVPNEVSETEIGLEQRTSVAHNFVRRFISKTNSKTIDTAEIVKRQDISNIGIQPKAIYNTLNYLASKGELKRIGRGRYLITSSGVGVESSVELDKLEDMPE
jgi:hypothetical protein